MKNKLLLVFLSLGLLALIYFTALRPTTTFDQRICAQLSNQSDVPGKIKFIDVNSTLVFCENDIGVMPVLINKEFTKVKKAFHALDFVEFKEENAPLSWQADHQEKFSMISGFATNEVKTIIINSEDNIQPNRFFIHDNLWFWYFTFHKPKVNMPIKVTAYDAKGQIIFGEDQ